jgi:hypothetical protein
MTSSAYRILVAEDSPTQAEHLRLLLEDKGYLVELAANGVEGLEKVSRVRPDMIISDVVMPGMDGYAFCHAVKSKPSARKIPFILFTERHGPADIIEGFLQGADNFISKSSPDDYLLERVRRILEQLEHRRGGQLSVHILVRVGGREISVSADKQQMFELLIATLEETARINDQLMDAQRLLQQHAQGLEGEVEERTRELQEAQQRLQHVVSSSPSVLYTLSVEGQDLVPAWVSENIERFSGYTPSDVAGAGWWADRLHPDDREGVIAQIPILLSERHVAREYRFRHKDGAYHWVRDEQVLIEDATGRREVVGSWSDITARKRAELGLQESEEQYRLLFDSNPHPMWVYDEDTLAFLAVNDAAVNHYGYSREEFLAMTLRDIRPPEEVQILDEFVAPRRRDRALKAFESPRVWKHRRKDGSLLDVEIAASPIQFKGRPAWLALATDVTEKKRLEAQLLQSQKMESVGRLAGGVAHDFNNLLGVITGYGDLLQRDIGPRHPAFARVGEIRKAADRAAALTRQLLAFSRKQVLEPKVLDLNAVVSDIEKMLRRLIGEDIQLITVFGSDLGRVKADPGQMEQVIVNMAVNARDAMPDGGKLIIETGNVDLDEAYARRRPDARPGPHVMLGVSDTGHGMNAETLSHMFEPFFSTKELGKGTGLGLATVYGIVRQSGGHVMVYSEPGRGTTFKVYLPRSSEEQEEAEEALAVAGVAQPPPAGTETILLIEDEASLRVMIREILESAGYQVLEGPTPEEALAAAGAHAGPIHLVLTDVVLPRMSGRQVAEALRFSRPDARVLYISGYTDDAISHHGILAPGVHFLQKPFTTDALVRKARDVLDAPLPHNVAE